MNLLTRKLLPLVALAALTSCSKNSSPESSSTEPVLAVVRAQADALNHEDMAAYMATVDPASPAVAQTKEMLAKLFATYDLRYTLKSVAVESINGDEAQVRFDQTTEKIAGPEFRNNEVKGVHTLKKRSDGWKFSSTRMDKLDYLDK